jgi:type I restriction enzyme S subunit
MAQNIFKSWFVDFDGVTEWDDSELGKIPKGWTVKLLGDEFTVTDYTANGSFASLKENVTYSYKPDYAILVRQIDFNNNWNGNYVYVDKHSYDFLKKSFLIPGDVMVSNIGNIGIVFKLPDLGKPMTGAPNILVIKTHDFKKEFVYNFLKSTIGQNLMLSIKSGSAQPKFNKTDFRNLKIILPTENIFKQFHGVTNSLRQKIEINFVTIKKLTQTRDALLPRLMSGEILV